MFESGRMGHPSFLRTLAGIVMFVEPARSPYDWHFSIAGFNVRVTWLFWVISAAWGHGWARSLDRGYTGLGLDSPGVFPLLVIWVGVSFLSILIHELGHSLMMRWFGKSSYIVLYHFGGLAIPENYGAWRGRFRRSPWEQIAISAAGPFLQLAFGILVAAIAIGMGYRIGETEYLLSAVVELPHGRSPENAVLMGLIDSAVYTSIFWAILNLVPVLPLDGGRIAQELIAMYGNTSGQREATVLSIVVAAGIALWAFQIQSPVLGMNFMMLAVLNYQSMNDPFSMR